MGGCCHKQYGFLRKAHHRTSSSPLSFPRSPLSLPEQKSKPSILVDSESLLDYAPVAFYAQKEELDDEDWEEEGTGVVFPIKFVDNGGRRGRASVPRIRLSTALSVIAESKASDSRRDAQSEFSFSRLSIDPAWEKQSEESEEISSPESEDPPVESSCATAGRTLLPPIAKSPGRSLRPLHLKGSSLDAATDSKLKRGSTQATTKQETKTGYSTLRGKLRYVLGTPLHVSGSLCTRVLSATSRGKGFVVYQYNKKKLRHMLLMRGKTALDAIQSQVALMSAASPHPHIAKLEEVIETDTRLYVVLDTEFACSLMDAYPVEEQRARDLLMAMIESVEVLHREMEAAHFDLRPSSFHLTKQGRIEMSWLHPILPLSALPGGKMKDALALCAILLMMLQGKPGAGEDVYEEVLEQVTSGELQIPLCLSAPLRDFLCLSVSAGDSLTPAMLATHAWLQNLT